MLKRGRAFKYSTCAVTFHKEIFEGYGTCILVHLKLKSCTNVLELSFTSHLHDLPSKSHASAGVAPICTESVDPLERVDCVFGPFVDHPLKIRDNPWPIFVAAGI